jgi:hypothetical protein
MSTPVRHARPYELAARVGAQSHGQSLRYRLDVVALDIADVVRSAGGWLYHRVAAGWEVNVLIPAPADDRALRILGVRTLGLDAELERSARGAAGAGLAVSDAAFTADARIRRWTLSALQTSRLEVTLWGDRWPVAVQHQVSEVRHVLTAAARAFKAQSLVAADGTGSPVRSTEVFRGARKGCLPLDSDLLRI